MAIVEFESSGMSGSCYSLTNRGLRDVKAHFPHGLRDPTRDRSVYDLRTPTQSKQHVFMTTFVCFEGNYKASVIGYLFDAVTGLIYLEAWMNLELSTPLQDHIEGLRWLRSDYRGNTRPDNGRLLRGNLFERFSKILLMIQGQRGNSHSFCSGHSRCIQPASQSSFQNSQPDAGFSESEKRNGRDLLKEGWQGFQFSAHYQTLRSRSDRRCVSGKVIR